MRELNFKELSFRCTHRPLRDRARELIQEVRASNRPCDPEKFRVALHHLQNAEAFARRIGLRNLPAEFQRDLLADPNPGPGWPELGHYKALKQRGDRLLDEAHGPRPPEPTEEEVDALVERYLTWRRAERGGIA